MALIGRWQPLYIPTAGYLSAGSGESIWRVPTENENVIIVIKLTVCMWRRCVSGTSRRTIQQQRNTGRLSFNLSMENLLRQHVARVSSWPATVDYFVGTQSSASTTRCIARPMTLTDLRILKGRKWCVQLCRIRSSKLLDWSSSGWSVSGSNFTSGQMLVVY